MCGGLHSLTEASSTIYYLLTGHCRLCFLWMGPEEGKNGFRKKGLHDLIDVLIYWTWSVWLIGWPSGPTAHWAYVLCFPYRRSEVFSLDMVCWPNIPTALRLTRKSRGGADTVVRKFCIAYTKFENVFEIKTSYGRSVLHNNFKHLCVIF